MNMSVDQQINILDFVRFEPAIFVAGDIDVVMGQPNNERIAVEE